MSDKLFDYFEAQWVKRFVGWVSQGRWQVVSTEQVDDLYAEIQRLEKTLSHAPTRPLRATRKSRPLEPITEQQKFLDM
ncbi:MAG: hypothetical protein AAF485_08790, partial [Chloroflexota bacterium]